MAAQLDQLLKRHFWAPTLMLTSVAAFFGARGVGNLFGASLGADDKQLAAPPMATKAAPTANNTTPKATSADPILARNPFDSVTGPLLRGMGTDENPIGLPVNLDDPMNAPICEGVKVLIIAASSDPDWSFAALSAPGDAKSQLRRRGGDFGGKEVKFVGWDRVWLTGGGQLCQALLFQPPTAPSTTPVASQAEPARPTGGPGSVPDDIKKGIQRISATEFNIDRGVVDKILENQAELMKQARIVPEQENGKVVGIRLFGVRNDTLLGVLGMENGDRLQSINGFDMTSPEKALEAYARLRTADHMTVAINRKGANTNLDYNIK
ncbi:MAG TPA: type II secretion system protein GspC [Polyangiaceae bacterium]|jgi:general secretion pathway protein C|nr:type II secretion system protein GspC [Polyangiaceae bacterium]